MSNCAIVGISWGDEGKGRMVDLLTKDYDIVVRYQGGGNAGHTVINEYGKFALHLLPSGIFRKGVINVLGNGVALDLENLVKEIDLLKEQGVEISPSNLLISDRTSILLPYHKDLDALEEKRLKDKAFGSTKQGIAPFYQDKYSKKTILMGELVYKNKLDEHLKTILEYKNLILDKVYQAKTYSLEEIKEYLSYYGEKLKPYIKDVHSFLLEAEKEGKNILFEAQLGALRDLDYGIHPFTTSSNVTTGFISAGSGLPLVKLDKVIGVVKAYSTCVGEGPFVSEYFSSKAKDLRERGQEYGAKTGRERRVGPFDVLATRYGISLQGANEIALTKLDILSFYEEIEVCVAYKYKEEILTSFPFPSLLDECEPVYKTLKGWNKDISSIRKYEDLPKEAKEYIAFIAKEIGAPIKYISVGASREAIIYI